MFFEPSFSEIFSTDIFFVSNSFANSFKVSALISSFSPFAQLLTKTNTIKLKINKIIIK